MALTTAELITRVRRYTNRTDTGSAATTDAEIVDYLNDSLRVLARRHTWQDLMIEASAATVDGTYRYALPSDLKECFGIRIIDGNESRWLIERTKFWLNQYEPLPTSGSEAKPDYYCIDGNYFEMYPVPDAAYTLYINYCKWPTELSATTTGDSPDLGQLDDALVAFGASQLFASLQKFEEANYWRASFEAEYRTAKAQDIRRPAFMPQTDAVITGGRSGPPAAYWNDPGIRSVH